jgi:hypothetical protein
MVINSWRRALIKKKLGIKRRKIPIKIPNILQDGEKFFKMTDKERDQFLEQNLIIYDFNEKVYKKI